MSAHSAWQLVPWSYISSFRPLPLLNVKRLRLMVIKNLAFSLRSEEVRNSLLADFVPRVVCPLSCGGTQEGGEAGERAGASGDVPMH